MENSREYPRIRYFNILAFVNDTHLGSKAAKSVWAASENRIQISYNGNRIKFKECPQSASECQCARVRLALRSNEERGTISKEVVHGLGKKPFSVSDPRPLPTLLNV